jgi:hypothetical protein
MYALIALGAAGAGSDWHVAGGLLMLARAELFLGRNRHAIATASEGLRLVEDRPARSSDFRDWYWCPSRRCTARRPLP